MSEENPTPDDECPPARMGFWPLLLAIVTATGVGTFFLALARFYYFHLKPDFDKRICP